MIRFIFRTAGMLFIVALIAAYFTNPTVEDFKKEVKERLQGEFQEHLDNPALALIAEEGMDFVADLSEKMVTRDEFYFFSIYTLELPTGDEKFVGIFGKFIPI